MSFTTELATPGEVSEVMDLTGKNTTTTLLDKHNS